jgi:uncharacterized DUF497 family protein
MKRVVADKETAAWLATRPEFLWDDGNSQKSAEKHGVSCAEAESLLERLFVLGGRVVSPVYPEPRWLLFGETRTGKLITMAFTRRGSKLRPISCRPMGRKERKFYAQVTADQEADIGNTQERPDGEELPR